MKSEIQKICEVHDDDSGKDNMESETRNRCEVQQDDDLGKDIISELPDELLHHILSCLPTKDIVRTSAFSTRWRWLWTFFTIVSVDFGAEDEDENDSASFLDLIQNKLLIPDTARIRKFRIHLHKYNHFYTYPNILFSISLVYKALKHQVEELELSFPHLWRCNMLSLPHTLFTSESLTSLKLHMSHAASIRLARSTLNLLERTRSVKSLRLSSETLKTISCAENVLADDLPTFHNLTRLKLIGGDCDLSAAALLHILHKSPKLQSIVFPHAVSVDEHLLFLEPLVLTRGVHGDRLRGRSRSGIIFDDHSTQSLLSACPVLKELYLDNCDWRKRTEITISISTLLALTTIFFDDNPPDISIGICTPNLLKFYSTSSLQVELITCDLSSVIRAEIDVFGWLSYDQRFRVQAAHRTLKLLERIRGVKFLELSYETFQAISFAENFQANHLPTFYNLTD
ncbi:hypothetical protein POUND7_006853 [Theobroma cacao]